MINYTDIPQHYENVPFYSQFRDIAQVEWRKGACGIAIMAMLIDFYKPTPVDASKLLVEGLGSGAYQPGIGWKHWELSQLANKYGLEGKTYNFTPFTRQVAFEKFIEVLREGPVMVSAHNKFDPKATLGHLVVATGFDKDYVFYNDPASGGVEKKISHSAFMSGWKKRLIVVREPAKQLTLELK